MYDSIFRNPRNGYEANNAFGFTEIGCFLRQNVLGNGAGWLAKYLEDCIEYLHYPCIRLQERRKPRNRTKEWMASSSICGCATTRTCSALSVLFQASHPCSPLRIPSLPPGNPLLPPSQNSTLAPTPNANAGCLWC